MPLCRGDELKGEQLTANWEYGDVLHWGRNVEPRDCYRRKHVFIGVGTLK